MRGSRYFPLALVALCLLATSVLAQTGRVKDDHVGCLTEDSLDQMTTALVKKDQRLYASLMGKVCVALKG